MITIHGRFEKGKWIPDALDGMIEGMTRLGTAIMNAVEVIGEFQYRDYGHFEKGAWISVTFKDSAVLDKEVKE